MHPALRRGIELFNAGSFWHAHEAWESLWLTSNGAEREFLRGLIQLAAAYHHVQRGNDRGAIRLFEAALRRIEEGEQDCFSLDRRELVRVSGAHREMLMRGERILDSELPKLRYNDGSLRTAREPHASEG